MTEFLLLLSVALLIYGAAQATRFVLRYRRTTWKRNREGRHLMGFTRALAVILWGTLVLAVLPVPLWLALVAQVILFGWLDFELTRRNYLFTLNQRERER